MRSEIIELREKKFKIKDIAEKLGISHNRVKNLIQAYKLPPLQKGRPRVDFFEQIVTFPVNIKRKHFNTAQKEIHEIIKKYR